MLCFKWPGKTPAATDSQARPWPFSDGRFRAAAVSDSQARPRWLIVEYLGVLAKYPRGTTGTYIRGTIWAAHHQGVG